MKWKLALGLALSAFFLALAFKSARLGDVVQALAHAEYWLMIPALALTVFAFAVRAVRWRFLLAGVRAIPFPPLFAGIMIGFMGNNLLPARLGELLRADSLGRSSGIRRSTALASVVVERILDIFFLLLLLGTILLLRPLSAQIRSWGGRLLALALPVFLALILYRAYPRQVLTVVNRGTPPRFRPRVASMAESFRDGLSAFTRAGSLFWAFVCSVIMWGCFALVVTLCLHAVHLRLPPEAGPVVMEVMAIGTMLPSAPGYIGTLQYSGKLALLQYGVDPSVALSFTFLYHASQWLPVTIIGLVCFFRQNRRLGRWTSLPGARSGEEEADRAGE